MGKWLGLIGVALLVMLDAALVFLAVRHTYAPPPAADFRSAALAESAQSKPKEPAESPAPRNPVTSEAPRDKAEKSLGTARYLDVSEDESFIRATQGSCDREILPSMEVSTDAGRSFRPADIPNVTEVLDVQADGSDTLRVVGTDQLCTPALYVTVDGGRSWQRSGDADRLWHMARDRSVPRVVHAPGGLVGAPCEPLSLSTVDNEILRILCVDGQVIGSDGLGSVWVSLGGLHGAEAASFTSAGHGFALADQASCSAAVMETFDGGATWNQVTCVDNGRLWAVAAAGDVVAAQVGGGLHVSTDAGASWSKRP